jgi:hypothetical protein
MISNTYPLHRVATTFELVVGSDLNRRWEEFTTAKVDSLRRTDVGGSSISRTFCSLSEQPENVIPAKISSKMVIFLGAC